MKIEIEISDETLEVFINEFNDVCERNPSADEIRKWVEECVDDAMNADCVWQTINGR